MHTGENWRIQSKIHTGEKPHSQREKPDQSPASPTNGKLEKYTKKQKKIKILLKSEFFPSIFFTYFQKHVKSQKKTEIQRRNESKKSPQTIFL